MSVHSITNRNETFWGLENLSVAKQRIMGVLIARPGGATRHEIAEALGMPLSSVAGRVCELEAEGLVISTEETRPTPYGKTATVVKVTRREKPVQLELF
jgi:predicted ArsR family transcriptional regulator